MKLNCLKCGKQTQRNKNRFCSQECYSEYKRSRNLLLIESKILNDEVVEHRRLRIYLLKIKGQCFDCGQGLLWNNKELSLHLDHIDGNSDNTRLSNVKLLCPNCHSQTDTWCSRNFKNTKRSERLRRSYYKNRVVSVAGDTLAFTQQVSAEFDPLTTHQ